MSFTHQEIADALEQFRAAADEAGRTGDWRPWVERFTFWEIAYGWELRPKPSSATS